MESESKTSDVSLKGRWQWKSNSDPWSKTEEAQWEFYSDEQNYLIEKAHYDKRTEVDLGEYIASIEHKRQSKKGNITSQRPIRRITCEDNEMDGRSERYFETELPKSINKIFGSLQHFITFFSRRNPEILHFTEQFQKFEQLNDLNGLNKEILPQLIGCLEEGLLKAIEEQLKDHSLSEFQKKIKQKSKDRHEELISMLKKEFASFEEFYGLVLKSYTMNTGLYLNLNQYLRDESWTALDNLLPYAICLCKAFFSFKLDHKDRQFSFTEDSIVLYRGTALDEFALSNYQTGEASVLFSWNSVTSTSRNKKMAEQFMYKSVDMEKKKYPVLFIIEIPLTDGTSDPEYLKWIDIHKYSAMPNEDEVILAPGSAFELVKFFTDQEKRTTIQVKLKPEVESLARGGLIMHGAFQNEMMSDRQVKIMCLEGEELYEALRNISGNRLIEEIEFCLCIFDQRSLEEMLLILPTLEKAKGLKFIFCKYEDWQEISSIKLPSTIACKIEEIEIYEVQDIFQILSLNKQDDNFWGSLRTVNIDFRNIVFDNFELPTFKFPTELTSMNLDFATCKLKDNVVNNLTTQGLKHLTQLTSLTLDFGGCYEISDEGVNNLASEALHYLTQLNSLTLDFGWCSEISDEGVSNLSSQALHYLTQLTSLTLDFGGCRQITDKGMSNLASQALKYLTQLTSLTLDFECSKISDDGMSNLASQALRYLTQLTSLTLNFAGCRKITNEGMSNLASQALHYLTQLTSLTLDFDRCYEITDKGMSNLASQALQYLTQLISLTLNFEACFKVSDEGMSNLASQALQYLTQLTSLILNEKVIKQTCQHYQTREDQVRTNNWLRLNFTRPKSQNQLRFLVDDLPSSTRSFENSDLERLALISKEDEEIEGALNKFLLELMYCQYGKMPPASALVTLSLCQVVSIKRSLDEKTIDLLIYSDSLSGETDHLFEREQIKDKGVSNSTCQALHYLTQLTSLTLNFGWCSKISDEGVSNLASQALSYLTQLTSLTLDFGRCYKITDKGVSNLASQALRYLTQLTSLTLNFGWCSKISDEGVSNLASQALSYLTQLISLTLNFEACFKVSDEGMSNLASQALHYLTQLTSLTLGFDRCSRISDKGMNNLASQALRYLTQLTSLTLDFGKCSGISDEGVNNLIYQMIRHSLQLTTLNLDFSDCKITKSTGKGMARVLHYFGFIESQK